MKAERLQQIEVVGDSVNALVGPRHVGQEEACPFIPASQAMANSHRDTQQPRN